jgi:hypothetical protein
MEAGRDAQPQLNGEEINVGKKRWVALAVLVRVERTVFHHDGYGLLLFCCWVIYPEEGTVCIAKIEVRTVEVQFI